MVLGFAAPKFGGCGSGPFSRVHTEAAFDPYGSWKRAAPERGRDLRDRWFRAGIGMKIANVTELEERLTRPSDAVISAMRAMDGDLLILGAGGKMGPSLAKLARRAADSAGTR